MQAYKKPTADWQDVSEFDSWWGLTGSWVELPNQRRGGESGVQVIQTRPSGAAFLYSKRQTQHLYRSIRHPFGSPTILRERAVYKAFSRLGITVPKLVYCDARKQKNQWQAILVTEALEGYLNLDDWYATQPNPLYQKMMLTELARTLIRMHSAGWQHGCLYAKHIFVQSNAGDASEPSVSVALLDLEKSRKRLFSTQARQHDLKQIRRRCPMFSEADMEFLLQTYHDLLKTHQSYWPNFWRYSPT